MANRLTFYIMIGLVLGIAVGAAMNAMMTPEAVAEAVKWFKMITDIFLRLIKMIVAPLVFATLVAGIVHMGDSASLGRVGAKTMTWFIGATLVSLTLGMVLVNWLQPGVNSGLDLSSAVGSSGIDAKHVDMFTTITEMVPKSIFEAMANTTMLQIVIFSVFFGVALSAVGEKGTPIVKGIDALVEVMLVVTNFVMRVSPLAVFAAMAKAIAVNGLGILLTFGKFIGSFYLGLGLTGDLGLTYSAAREWEHRGGKPRREQRCVDEVAAHSSPASLNLRQPLRSPHVVVLPHCSPPRVVRTGLRGDS